VHRQGSGERALLEPEASARHVDAAGAQPLAEMRDRAGAERDVDERVEREEPLALGLGVAAADSDHFVRVTLFERAGLCEMGGKALIWLLADRAGVEDEHIRFVLGQGLPQSELLEHALDALRVVRVHLAAEGGDVVALHRRETVSAWFLGLDFPQDRASLATSV
jgi:hypothetical protein